MCDYSLTVSQSRPAIEGERLVVYRFRSGLKGFVGEDEVPGTAAATPGLWARVRAWIEDDEGVCAVCLEPGMQLVLRDIPEPLRNGLQVRSEELVTFAECGRPGSYRDGVRFRTGAEVSLQDLPVGMIADVVATLPDPALRFLAEEPVDQFQRAFA